MKNPSHSPAVALVQDNSCGQVGLLRSLHYQLPPHAQKLVREITGSAFDVVVDIRRGSPTFGRWAGMKLKKRGSARR